MSLRAFPYPFAGAIGIASDVDGQSPALGAAIHRVLHDELGLALGNSTWIHRNLPPPPSRRRRLRRVARQLAHTLRRDPARLREVLARRLAAPASAAVLSPAPSSAFFAAGELDAAPSGVDGLPAYALLLREWHRGHVDHLHGWHEDYTARVVDRVGRRLRPGANRVRLPAPPALEEKRYDHLRLWFAPALPPLTRVRARDGRGRTARFDAAALARGASLCAAGADRAALQLSVGVPGGAEPSACDRGFDLGDLRRLELTLAPGAEARLESVEREAFSRFTVLHELPWLEAHGVRPHLITCHGGHTHAQNIAVPGSRWQRKEPAWLFGQARVASDLASLGDAPAHPARHLDLLRRLGVEQVWGLDRASHLRWDAALPPPARGYEGVYRLHRTDFRDYELVDPARFVEQVAPHVPHLSCAELLALRSPPPNTQDQGSMLGLMMEVALAQLRRGERVEQLWYTHLATGDATHPRTAAAPLPPTALVGLRKLAAHHHGWGGAPDEARVWVAPAGVLARYRLVRAAVGEHLQVEGDLVRVASWVDPVTGRRRGADTRDLHGVTVHVPDAARARLELDGRPCASFTRNPPDASGRPSITVVDDTQPTIAVGGLPLALQGPVAVEGGAWADRAGEAPPRLEAEGAAAWVSLRPRRLSPFHTHHLALAWTRTGAGRAVLELELPGGRWVVAAQGSGEGPPLGADAGWWLEPVEGAQQVVLAVAQLAFAPGVGGAAPPLPQGPIAGLRFGLVDAEPGARLELHGLRFLRPGPGPRTEAVVLGGRVRDGDGRPRAGVRVEVTWDGEPRPAQTDAHGCWYLPDVPRGAVVELAAVWGGRRHPPVGPPRFEVAAHDVELEFEIF